RRAVHSRESAERPEQHFHWSVRNDDRVNTIVPMLRVGMHFVTLRVTDPQPCPIAVATELKFQRRQKKRLPLDSRFSLTSATHYFGSLNAIT
ncbi:hypothetical protein P4A91_24730, partial [Pseudomonas syringae]|nr:hypothetical protein [Pseudomonas syringae]